MGLVPALAEFIRATVLLCLENSWPEVTRHLWLLQSYKPLPEPQGWGISQTWYRVIHSGLGDFTDMIQSDTFRAEHCWFFHTGLCWTSDCRLQRGLCCELRAALIWTPSPCCTSTNLTFLRRDAGLSWVRWLGKHSWVCHCSPFLWTLPSWLPVGKLQPSPTGTQHIQESALSTTCSVNFQARLTSSQSQKPIPMTQ